MWIILTLIALVSFSFARILQKSLLTRESDSIAYALYFQFLVAIIIFPVAIFNGFKIPPLQHIWFNLILMILLYGFANIFSYLSLKFTPVSEFIILLSTIPIWTVLTSIPILHESVSPFKIIGIILALIGVISVFYSINKIHLNIGHFFSFITAILFGVAYTNDAILLHYFSATTYSVIYFLLPALFVAIVYPNKIGRLGYYLKKHNILKFFATALLFAIAAVSINTSYKLGGEISQISTIVQLNSILTVFLGIFLLNEKENLLRKIIGGIIVIAVIVLIQMR